MNKRENENQDDYKSLLLMSELEEGEAISQREIASRLGIALGLVNSYLKNLVQKGYVTVKAYPRNRYAYLLTPQGFSEKSRLAFKHLSHFTRLYNVARRDFQNIFQEIAKEGHSQVVFCGVGETAEIAYLSLQEAGLEIACVLDLDGGGEFFGMNVMSLTEGIASIGALPVVVTDYYQAESLRNLLIENGVSPEAIYQIGAVN